MTKTNLLQELFNINVINLEEEEIYTWKSGIKAPIYIDNRLVISYPILRKEIISQLKQLIIENYDLNQIDILFGTATAGIAPAILLSESLNLPSGYIRVTEKQHGKKKTIEGFYQEKWKAIVIEDTIATGSSVFNVIEILKKAKIEVLGVVTIFNYGLKKTQDQFIKKNLKFNSLITFDDLLLENKFLISTKKKNKLLTFYHEINK